MKPNGFDHPKIWEFAQRLGIRKREAWGIVDRFWDITAKYAERGDCGKLHDALVAERVDWTGEGETPEKLIDALLGSGLIDPHPVHRFVVHDWHDHAPDYVKRKCSGQKATPTREGVEGVGWAQDDEPEPSAAISQDIETINEPGSSESSGKFQNDPEDSTPPIPSLPIPTSEGNTCSDPPGSEPSDEPPTTDQGSKTRHPDALPLAEHLRDSIATHVPAWTPPKSLKAWTLEFDRMLRLDGQGYGIPPDQIRIVIDWVVRDDFERANVQSAGKLRKRFGQLHTKATARASPNARPSRLEIISKNLEASRRRDLERLAKHEANDTAGGAGGSTDPIFLPRRSSGIDWGTG